MTIPEQDISPFDIGYAAGPKRLMEQSPIAVYASRRIPLSVLETAERTVQAVAASGHVLAGGWHSRMEKRLLRIALEVPDSNVAYVLAKGIRRFRLPTFAHSAYAAQRLLVLSPFEDAPRITRQRAKQRDAWIRSLVNRYLFCYIDGGGNVEKLFHTCLQEGKTVLLLDHPQNAAFADEATQRINPYNFQEVLTS
jgi:hypothetical protein